MEGYWCYWHGGKGYSGVALHVSKTIAPARPLFTHPTFDYENRIVAADVNGVTIASIYVPNGGKDFPAKMRFLEAMETYARAFRDAGTSVILCGDLNVARTEMRRAPERAEAESHRSASRGACADRTASSAAASSDVGRTLDPARRRPLHVVAAMARTCASGTSVGGSTTCSRAHALPNTQRAVPCKKTSARATTHRSWRRSRRISASARRRFNHEKHEERLLLRRAVRVHRCAKVRRVERRGRRPHPAGRRARDADEGRRS